MTEEMLQTKDSGAIKGLAEARISEVGGPSGAAWVGAPSAPVPNPLKAARKAFSRTGFFLLVIGMGLLIGSIVISIVLTLAFNLLYGMGFRAFSPSIDFLDGDGAYVLELVTYAIFIPLGMLALRKVPKFHPERTSMPVWKVIALVGVALALSTAASMASDIIVDAIWGSMGSEMTSTDFMEANFSDVTPMSVLFVVMIGPIVEEFIFRKQVITHTLQYGETLAIVFSACMFGLFHGNFSQALYTFTFGLVAGYLYVRTGKMRYNVGLHIFNNGLSMMGTAAFQIVLNGNIITGEGTDWDVLVELFGSIQGAGASGPLALIGVVLGILYLVVEYGLIIYGVACMWYLGHHMGMRSIVTQLPRGMRLRTALGNPGVILFVLWSVGEALLIILLYA